MSDLTSVFIPAKEILSNAWNLDAAVKMGNVEFDDTYLDIIAAAKIDISRGVDSAARKKYLDILQKISSGKVTLHDDRFYLKPGTQAKLLIMLESEGVQIFVSTHDYFLSKYIEVKRSKESEVQYISLYKDDEEKVQCETATEFELHMGRLILQMG